MGFGRLPGRRGRERDGEAAAVRVGRFARRLDGRSDAHRGRERHAAEPGLIGLHSGRTAGEQAGGGEGQKGAEHDPAHSSAPSRGEALLLGAIAANLHLAPPAAIVLGGVEEKPAAGVAVAALDAGEIALGEQIYSGKRDRAERRLDRRGFNAPGPPAGGPVRDERGARQEARVKARETLQRRVRRRGVGGDRRTDVLDRRTQSERRGQKVLAALRERRAKPFDVIGRRHWGVRNPVCDVLRAPQMVLMRVGPPTGLGVGEIERKRAADERQRAGARWRKGKWTNCHSSLYKL